MRFGLLVHDVVINLATSLALGDLIVAVTKSASAPTVKDVFDLGGLGASGLFKMCGS